MVHWLFIVVLGVFAGLLIIVGTLIGAIVHLLASRTSISGKRMALTLRLLFDATVLGWVSVMILERR